MSRPEGFLKICILNSLKERPMHGYELMKLLESHGWKPSPGSIYPVLNSLKKKKLISLRAEGNKKIYSITRSGVCVIRNIDNHREHIIRDMKRTARVVSGFLGNEFAVDTKKINRIKNHPDVALPMMRVARKIILCVEKKSNVAEVKRILHKTERQIDNLLK